MSRVVYCFLDANGVPVAVSATNPLPLTATGAVQSSPTPNVIYGTDGSGNQETYPIDAANGIGLLDASGKFPTALMPVGDVTYKGNWNATTNTPTLANGAGTAGDLYICDVAGSQDLGGGAVSYGVGDWLIYDGATWDQISGHGPAGANPSVTVGLTAKNGMADTYMRSDGAPALDVAIAPTWTGAHTFNQTVTTAAISASGLISSSAGVSGNTTVTAGIGSNSVQMYGAANGSDPGIQALGATDANVSIEMKAKGTGLLKLSSPTNVTGAFNASSTATFGGNVTVAGQLGSADNTSLPSPTNSGITIGGSPTWAMASFYDQAVTANNRSADLLFISNSFKLRFANDARSSFLDVLSINGGQALGVTGITSTSGSGNWVHTGGYEVTGNFSGNGFVNAGSGLRVKEGTNAKQGVATLTAGTVTVSNTSVTADSRIFLTGQDSNVTGALSVSARTAGTSFTITSSVSADTGVVAYQIFEPGQ